jgi:hypothetical protein
MYLMIVQTHAFKRDRLRVKTAPFLSSAAKTMPDTSPPDPAGDAFYPDTLPSEREDREMSEFCRRMSKTVSAPVDDA